MAANARRNGRIVELVAPPRRHRVVDRLDKTIIQQLVMDYEDGIPTTQLAIKYGIAKGTVVKLLKQDGVAARTAATRSRSVQVCPLRGPDPGS